MSDSESETFPVTSSDSARLSEDQRIAISSGSVFFSALALKSREIAISAKAQNQFTFGSKPGTNLSYRKSFEFSAASSRQRYFELVH